MSQTRGRFRRGLNTRNTHIRDVSFLIKTLQKTLVNFCLTFFTQFRENKFGSRETFIKPVIFWENWFYSYIYISTLLFYYIHMMMIHLFQTPPNMSSIGAVYDSLGKTFLSLLIANLGATGGLQVNSSPVKVKLIIFPLFLPEGTGKSVCVLL